MRLDVSPLWRRLWDWSSQPAPIVQEAPIPMAEVVEPEVDVDRRMASRFPCHREAWLHPVTLVQNAPWHAIVLDVSTHGIALAIERPVVTGTFFAIELPDELQGTVKRIRGRVVHATAQGHNYWHIGCLLESELTNEEVQGLV